MKKSTLRQLKKAYWDDNGFLTVLAFGLVMLFIVCVLTSCTPFPKEVEWHENGQLKAVRYYRRGVTSIKMFCYDTDNHNQSQAVPAQEER